MYAKVVVFEQTDNLLQVIFLLAADADLVAWQPIQDNGIEFSRSAPVPEGLRDHLFTRGHSISWERLLLDMHSGRIATRAGTFLVDLAGILLLFLAITGLTIWFKRLRRNGQPQG